MYSSP
jgi:hypothetical protein